jgi:UDP-N-acetylglucosamine--N-acetylmuramyl-(pentapeptide) pyrophosphoryl-undecaprenol N-acetylglucosamine transferase
LNSNPEPYRVLFAAGGTGGHVYPAIAIADAIASMQEDTRVLFAGTRTHMEWSAVPAAGYAIRPIWISGFHRRLTLTNLLFPIKLMVSLVQSWFIIRDFRPHAVVCCGGYVSGPVGRVAAMMGIPLMLQEQNSFPGVTNRLLGKSAHMIFTAFQEAATHFPSEKVRQFGNPVRKGLTDGNRELMAKALGFDSDTTTLLVMGGSGGAGPINQAVLEHLDTLHNQAGLQIVWQCGKRYLPELRNRLDETRYPRLRLVDFIDDMAGMYALSDLVLCRAGAGTLAELALTGKASVLVPSPYVAGNHQHKNAASFASRGAAVLLTDSELTQKLGETVAALSADRAKRIAMSAEALNLAKPDAAEAIARDILHQTNNESLSQVS